MMIRMVGGWVFLLVPAHPGRPGQRTVKRSLLLLLNASATFLGVFGWQNRTKTGFGFIHFSAFDDVKLKPVFPTQWNCLFGLDLIGFVTDILLSNMTWCLHLWPCLHLDSWFRVCFHIFCQLILSSNHTVLFANLSDSYRLKWMNCFLWPPYGIGQTIIFLPCGFFMAALCNRAGHIYVYHTSTHGVALV